MKNMCALFNMKFHAYFIKLICSIAAHRIFKCVKMTFSCNTYSFGAFYVEWGKIRFDSLITGSFMIFTPFKFRTSAILPIFYEIFVILSSFYIHNRIWMHFICQFFHTMTRIYNKIYYEKYENALHNQHFWKKFIFSVAN